MADGQQRRRAGDDRRPIGPQQLHGRLHRAALPLSAVTITETYTGGMVFEGDVATFHVHAEWTWPAGRPTVFYSTMDPSGAAPTDYVSVARPAGGGVPGAATYDSDTGDVGCGTRRSRCRPSAGSTAAGTAGA